MSGMGGGRRRQWKIERGIVGGKGREMDTLEPRNFLIPNNMNFNSDGRTNKKKLRQILHW
jgi:hypothetical protein